MTRSISQFQGRGPLETINNYVDQDHHIIETKRFKPTIDLQRDTN